MFKSITRVSLILLGLFLIGTATLTAAIKEKPEKGKNDQVQREPAGVYDQQQNTVSSIQFETTNYGIFGYNVRRGEGGGYWPRGSRNQYIFAGGIWIGAQKPRPGDTTFKKYVSISYNPNNGRSWFVPGRIDDGDLVDETTSTKYRAYFSTDFVSDGRPIDPDDGEYWPIWDASDREEDTLMHDRYFGYYISDPEDRDLDVYPKGPAFISGEDIFSTYKDTDLGRYDDGLALRKRQGYPLRLQFEQMIYSWGFGDYADFIFIKYDIISYAPDTLWNVWLAPVMDVDIALAPNTQAGAGNDHTSFCFCDDTLNMAYQWTDGDRGEEGNGFGYLGFDFLESPAVIQPEYNEQGEIINPKDLDFVRKDKKVFTNEEQLGLVTVRNWNISDDISEDEGRYNFISSRERDKDDGPGDKRFMMSTGPFHMRPAVNGVPQDTVRTVVGIILANTAVLDEADGSCADIAELIRKDKFAQTVYDKNFQAPQPPDAGRFTGFDPLNHGVRVEFDSTSEFSVDRFERGLNMMGYSLYRARRIDLDTFDVDQITPNLQYTKGKGPFGWKEVARWNIPTPFRKSSYRAGHNDNDLSMPMIDSLRILGFPFNENGKIEDSMAIAVMRVPRGVVLYPQKYVENNLPSRLPGHPYYPVVGAIDTASFSKPWGEWYADHYNEGKSQPHFNGQNIGAFDVTPYGRSFYFNTRSPRHQALIDSVMIGTLRLNRALMKYNPLFFRPKTFQYSRAQYDSLPESGIRFYSYMLDDTTRIIDSSRVDTVFKMNTFRVADLGGGQYASVIDALVRVPIGGTLEGYHDTLMTNTAWIRSIEDSIYSYIKTNRVSDITWTLWNEDARQFEESRQVQTEVLVPYFTQVTGREFIDVGDDNFNGEIEFSDNPTESERLINNVDYYYKLLAYDEGDYLQPTPRKYNNASSVANPNIILTHPQAAPAGKDPVFEVVSIDDEKIGGLYDFNMYAINTQRVMQEFAGHELELKFEPYWNQYSLALPEFGADNSREFGLYQRNMTLTDLTTGRLLYSGLANFEASPCNFAWRGLFTEDAFSYVFSADPIIDSTSFDPATGEYTRMNTFGTAYDYGVRQRSGIFTSGDFRNRNFCYALNMLPPAYGTLGFEFKYSMQQFGGIYRGDSTTFDDYKYDVSGNPVTPVGFIEAQPDAESFSYSKRAKGSVFTTQWERTELGGIFSIDTSGSQSIFPQNYYGSFNNGPGHYLVEFMPGGKDTLNVWYGDNKTQEFICDYMTLKVRNVIQYNRPAGGGDSVAVTYPREYKHVVCGWDTVTRVVDGELQVKGRRWDNTDRWEATYRPIPRNLPSNGKSYEDFIEGFNVSAFGLVNARSVRFFPSLNSNFAYPSQELKDIAVAANLGEEGRYYTTAVSANGQDTLDFIHFVNIAGVQFYLNYANQFGIKGLQLMNNRVSPYTYGEDFTVGDKVMFKTFGGALGMPLPGASVRFKISEANPQGGTVDEEQLSQIQVVPNPYYISHQGQHSPYDAKVYFTRLPERCTIDIYTVYGSLIKSIDHNEFNADGEDTRHAVQLWDLLSSNGQRVVSQTLVAVITTPDGAQTVKNFSVVVGGFRLVPED
ncbi:MAG: hypothetical protein ACLFQX_06470 [Candidatus Kapaibacterium sp.]